MQFDPDNKFPAEPVCMLRGVAGVTDNSVQGECIGREGIKPSSTSDGRTWGSSRPDRGHGGTVPTLRIRTVPGVYPRPRHIRLPLTGTSVRGDCVVQ